VLLLLLLLLLLLSSDVDVDTLVARLLRPAGHTPNPLDYSTAWQLLQVCRGGGALLHSAQIAAAAAAYLGSWWLQDKWGAWVFATPACLPRLLLLQVLKALGKLPDDDAECECRPAVEGGMSGLCKNSRV
jgi:hypothetical protein